jgi:hypothetical protein
MSDIKHSQTICTPLPVAAYFNGQLDANYKAFKNNNKKEVLNFTDPILERWVRVLKCIEVAAYVTLNTNTRNGSSRVNVQVELLPFRT